MCPYAAPNTAARWHDECVSGLAAWLPVAASQAPSTVAPNKAETSPRVAEAPINNFHEEYEVARKSKIIELVDMIGMLF